MASHSPIEPRLSARVDGPVRVVAAILRLCELLRLNKQKVGAVDPGPENIERFDEVAKTWLAKSEVGVET